MIAGQGAVPIPLGTQYASALGWQPNYSPLSAFSTPGSSAVAPRIQAMGTSSLSTPTLGTPVLGSNVLSSPALSSSATNSARFPAVPPEVRSSSDLARLAASASPGRMMRNGIDTAMNVSRALLPHHKTPDSSVTAPFGSSVGVPVSRPQASSPRPLGSQTEVQQLEYLSPRRDSALSVRADGYVSPRRGSVANDGYVSPRRGSVQSIRGEGYVSPARGSVISVRSEQEAQNAANKYINKKILAGMRDKLSLDGTFKTDAIHGDRSDSFKAMESQALARSNSPQRTGRSASPRTRNTWVPSGKANNLLATQEPRKEGRRMSPSRSGALAKPRTVDRCHKDLYEDAFNRKSRLKELQQHSSQVQDREEQKRMETFGQSMKEWRKLYKLKDTRSQAQREEEMIKKREETLAKAREMKQKQQLEELAACTFKPDIRKRQGDRCRSPRGQRIESDDPPTILRQLLERQRNAVASLQELAVGDLHLREHLSTVHAEYHDRIQREETQRVVLMLQDADTEGSAQRELIDRVRRMVAAGDDPEVAQRQIVEELVARSQDEVKRRVLDAFGPIQLEAEGKLYHKRLSLVHELESIEAQVVALKGGTLVAEARELGFEFGLADKSRRTLPAVPVLSAMRMTSGDDEGRLLRAQSTSSSNPTPRHSPRYVRPSTPRSQSNDDVSRQSSGQQPSLSGSVLQPGRHDSEDFVEASFRSASGLSLGSGMATSSSMPLRSRVGSAPPRSYGLVNAPTQTLGARPHSSSAVESTTGTALAPGANPEATPPVGATTPPIVPLSQAVPDDDPVMQNGANLSLPLGTSVSSSVPESATPPDKNVAITSKAMPDAMKQSVVVQASPLVLPMSAVQPRLLQDSTLDSARGRQMLASGQAIAPGNTPPQSTFLATPLPQQQLLQQQFQYQTQLAQGLTAQQQQQVAASMYFATGQLQQGFQGRLPARSM